MLPPEPKGGFIIRTMAETATDAELGADLDYLRRLWTGIQERARVNSAPALLYQDLDLSLRVLRDFASDSTERILVDSRETFQRMSAFARDYTLPFLDRLQHYTGERPLFDVYGVEEEIERALARRVALKSGGYLILDQTEALTTVDVNTGGFVGGRSFDDTIFKTNLEAAQVIARQLRLRNFDNHKNYLQKAVGAGSNIVVVSNPTVFALHGQFFIRNILPKRFPVTPVMIGDGERYKNQTTVNRLYDRFLDIGVGRNDVIVALGGGVVGDTAGYAAATYMRGIRLIQTPTTLLAMVDSSVGGKVGINHRQGKNLIGAFHQPQAVVIDTRWLTTLPQQDLISGMGEIIKTAFISSPGVLRQVSTISPDTMITDMIQIRKLIQISLMVKGEIVGMDVYDQGIRAVLNFGHTFAHAIEKVDGYGRYRHGEAVLAGMAGALYLSRRSEYLAQNVLDEYLAILAPFVAGLKPLSGSGRDYLSAMSVDKKIRNRRNVFILLEAAGKPLVRAVASDRMILGAIDQMMEFINSRRRI